MWLVAETNESDRIADLSYYGGYMGSPIVLLRGMQKMWFPELGSEKMLG
jgi:hypothetical protein